MEPAALSQDERQEALTRFIERYLKRGFRIVSHSSTTAELFKPARFPEVVFREQTYFVDIDETGVIYVKKA